MLGFIKDQRKGILTLQSRKSLAEVESSCSDPLLTLLLNNLRKTV